MVDEHISRRNFITSAGLIAAAAAVGGSILSLEGAKRISLIDGQIENDLRASNVKNPAFLKAHEGQLRNISIGCSLSPEQLDYLGVRFSQEDVIHFLSDLGIQTVRFGLRWNEIEKWPDEKSSKSVIDLTRYERYLQLLFDKQINVILSIGAKVPRYPEFHIPRRVLTELEKKSQLPAKGTVIQSKSELAKRELDYRSRLILALRERFNDYIVRPSLAFQLDNEPFTPFGPDGWTFTQDFITESYLSLHSEFPNAKLMINSPGVGNVATTALGFPNQAELVASTIETLLGRDPTLAGKLLAGYDAYHAAPNTPRLPFSRHFMDMNATVQLPKGVDIWRKYVQRATSYKLMVAEAQAEPWKGSPKGAGYPGDSARDWRYTLLRCLRVLNTGVQTDVLMWGVEHALLKKQNGQTQDHKDILYLTKAINQM